ncbi:MAG TPA: MFS transporter [Methanotrichaceae archaeon]|nr:MFS transporter [Methanotrichaceae archaeon]
MRTFYRLLGVALIAITAANFVWFALTYWAYLTTRSVISTSVLAGIWLVVTALSSNWFGSIIDRYKKKQAMMGSSIATLLLFASGFLLFRFSPEAVFATVASLRFWIFAIILLMGVIAGSMYSIAVPTLVAFLVPEDQHDRANGLFGTVMGTSFVITSAASGLALAFGGMSFVLLVAIIFTLFSAAMLWTIPIPETTSNNPVEGNPERIGIRGTIVAMKAIPGLFALIFFTTINNFLGGAFVALMDAYGLSLVTVQVWGLMWAFLSFSFILGGLYISKKGLGSDPLRKLKWISAREALRLFPCKRQKKWVDLSYTTRGSTLKLYRMSG